VWVFFLGVILYSKSILYIQGKNSILESTMQVGNLKNIHAKGFTLVELLIVIVIIGILVSISIVAYNGSQGRARDSLRQNDISELSKGLELYYLDNHKYPTSGGSSAINNLWTTTADASWQTLVTALKPYMDNNVPSDPTSSPNLSVLQPQGYNYAYYTDAVSGWCGAAPNQMYLLVYRLEASAQVNTLNGNCVSPVFTPYANISNWRMTRL
jgi:type II secretion system protein G